MSEYTTFRGKPCCVCLAEWLPHFERELLRRHVIKKSIDVYQLRGNAAASSNTHSQGGAFDVAQTQLESIKVARQMGADATWHRPKNWDGHGGISHTHGVLRGCPHNSPARYQIAAVDAGYNGLGRNGHGARDTGPRPLSGRTWKQGIAWAKEQAGQAPAPTPTSTVFDHAHWNVASPKPGWFPVPWSQRGTKIGQQLADLACSVVTVNECHFSYQSADISQALGSNFQHVSSPIGNDLFFDQNKYDQTRAYAEYSLGAQNRYAGVLHLVREQTGQHLTIVNTHLPYNSTALRSVAARNLVKLLASTDGPVILAGDFNNQSFVSGTPHYYLRRAGYKFLREQCAVTNGSQPEYPGKGQWLSDIATGANGPARLTSGVLTLTSSKLSDHRPLKARVEIK